MVLFTLIAIAPLFNIAHVPTNQKLLEMCNTHMPPLVQQVLVIYLNARSMIAGIQIDIMAV